MESSENTLISSACIRFKKLSYGLVYISKNEILFLKSFNLYLNGKLLKKIDLEEYNIIKAEDDYEEIIVERILELLNKSTDKSYKDKSIIDKDARKKAANELIDILNF